MIPPHLEMDGVLLAAPLPSEAVARRGGGSLGVACRVLVRVLRAAGSVASCSKARGSARLMTRVWRREESSGGAASSPPPASPSAGQRTIITIGRSSPIHY